MSVAVQTIDADGVEVLCEESFTLKPIAMPTTSEKIEEYRSKFGALTIKGIDDKEGYENVTKALSVLRSTRVAIEKTRKDLKADSLEYGRRVDAIAKELTSSIEALEVPLSSAKQSIDQEKERLKREKAEAAQRALEEEIRKKREAEEAELARLKAIEDEKRAAEDARLKAERDRLCNSECTRVKSLVTFPTTIGFGFSSKSGVIVIQS